MAELNTYNEVDYFNEMKSRITFAFEDAIVFKKYLELLALEGNEVQLTLKQLMQERSIDTAKGVQLDIIGDIVGQPRELINIAAIPFFGYIGAPQAQGYGDENDLTIGGYYWDGVSPRVGNIELEDPQYRIFIKSKIVKNRTRATPEDVITYLRFVLDAEKVFISLDRGGNALITILGDLGQFERAILTYFTKEDSHLSFFIPKTLGVKYHFASVPSGDFFGFLGLSGAKGYGTIGDASYDGEYKYDGSKKYNILGSTKGGGVFSSIIV